MSNLLTTSNYTKFNFLYLHWSFSTYVISNSYSPSDLAKVLVIKSYAGSSYKTKSEPVGLFRVHESLVLLITILGGI